MTEQEVSDNLQDLAAFLKTQLPENWGFILLSFPFGPGGRLLYVANARRLDALRAMQEWITKTKEGYGKDLPEGDEDTELGRLRQRVAELEALLIKHGIGTFGVGKKHEN